MKTKTLLLSLFIAGLFASHCLEGMEKKKKPFSVLEDDTLCYSLGFLNTFDMVHNFRLSSKYNQALVNETWTNKAYCGNRQVKIEYDDYTKESFLKFCKKHPNWPYAIKFAKNSTDIDVNAVLRLCGNVRELDVRYYEITDWDNIQWPQSLEELNLERTNITVAGLSKILSVCTKLKMLYLYECNQITEWDNIQWPQSLEDLDLSYANITAEGLNKILSVCTKLRSLELWGCDQVTEWNNIQWPQSLEVLNLRYTSITVAGLNKILSVGTNLKALNLDMCKQITEKDVAKLRSKYTDCKIYF